MPADTRDNFGNLWTAGRAPDGLPDGTLALVRPRPVDFFCPVYGNAVTVAYGYPIYWDALAPKRSRYFVGQRTADGTFALGAHYYPSVSAAVSALRERASRSGVRADTSTFVRIESVTVGKGGYKTVSVIRRDANGFLFRCTHIRPPHTAIERKVG